MLLLLNPLDGVKHSDVKAVQNRCVHVCKGTSSSYVAFEADRLVLEGWSAQIIFSTSSFSEPLRYPPWLAYPNIGVESVAQL